MNLSGINRVPFSLCILHYSGNQKKVYISEDTALHIITSETHRKCNWGGGGYLKKILWLC